MRIFLKSKIHRAKVTQADLNYAGSLTLDAELMKAADLASYEQVHVLNLATGARFETYVIPGKAGSGEVCLNGAAARLGAPGDLVLILSYIITQEAPLPRIVHVDDKNHVREIRKGDCHES